MDRFFTNETVSEFDIKKFKNMTCTCQSSPYMDPHHKHVITGNLDIVDNLDIQNLIRKGPKFREPVPINWNLNKKIIFTALENYVREWETREPGDNDGSLDEYLEQAKKLVKDRVSSLKRKQQDLVKPILSDETNKEFLDHFKSQYVCVPADKASNNIIIICKKFYYEILVKELGLSNTQALNKTYTKVRTNIGVIIRKHVKVLSKYKFASPSEKQEDLPQIYWIPKLHKNPIKSRFIAGSRTCTTKRLSGLLTKCLQAIKDQCKFYCDRIYQNSGVNCFWILKNSKDLIQHVENVTTKPIKCISTWDFSTLYTTIPHADLKIALKTVIDRVMSGGKYSKIHCNLFHAYFSKEENKNYLALDKKELCAMLNFLIDNIYVKFGSQIFRQTIGIPMGTDCAPVLADLFLHHYEFKFMKELMETNINLARKFNYTFRYIDDLQSQNNPGFASYVSGIYPSALELKETTNDLSHMETDNFQRPVAYLDILFSFDRDGILSYKLYDKRDDFDFDIVNFPHLCGNIPSGPAYGVYISQLVRYSRCCQVYDDFMLRHRNLVTRLLAQGFTVHRLRKTFNRFCNNYCKNIAKYKTSLNVMAADVGL